MKNQTNINLIFAFVHQSFKRVTRKGKEILFKGSNWLLINDLSEKEFSKLLFLAMLENSSKPKKSISKPKKVRHTEKTVYCYGC